MDKSLNFIKHFTEKTLFSLNQADCVCNFFLLHQCCGTGAPKLRNYCVVLCWVHSYLYLVSNTTNEALKMCFFLVLQFESLPPSIYRTSYCLHISAHEVMQALEPISTVVAPTLKGQMATLGPHGEGSNSLRTHSGQTWTKFWAIIDIYRRCNSISRYSGWPYIWIQVSFAPKHV